MFTRLNAYRIMWVFVMFDLPTLTKRQVKAASLFRSNLLRDGFSMFQYSLYIRHCNSRENAQVHIKRVKSFIPPEGHVCIFDLTDKQFGMMQIVYNRAKIEKPDDVIQLELF
ncbi:MAG: CRISPR-associated endonuclease Cas2 [Saprospiraceae bacterium]|nr:CRISPR-associated endonuclease Cas2 [Saprospiraceae bacterium]